MPDHSAEVEAFIQSLKSGGKEARMLTDEEVRLLQQYAVEAGKLAQERGSIL